MVNRNGGTSTADCTAARLPANATFAQQNQKSRRHRMDDRGF
jgi:hypothetical protein